MGKENKKSNCNKEKKLSISRFTARTVLLIGILTIVVGLLIIAIFYSIDVVAVIPKDWTDKLQEKRIIEIVINIFICCGTTFITIGFGSILYGTFDFVNYTRDQIKNVIIEHNFTDSWNDEEKKEFAEELLAEVYHQDKSSNIINFVHKELATIASMPYFEDYVLTVSCEKKRGIIYKSIAKDYTLNCSVNRDYDIFTLNSFQSAFMIDDEIETPLIPISLRINDVKAKQSEFVRRYTDSNEIEDESINCGDKDGNSVSERGTATSNHSMNSSEEMNNSVQSADDSNVIINGDGNDSVNYDNDNSDTNLASVSNSSRYNFNSDDKRETIYTRAVEYTIDEKKKEQVYNIKNSAEWDCKYKVKAVLKTAVKEHDIIFSFRMQCPCKRATFVFSFSPNEFDVDFDVFAFKDTDIEGISENIHITRNVGSITVIVDSWMLPGDGISFILMEPLTKSVESYSHDTSIDNQ